MVTRSANLPCEARCRRKPQTGGRQEIVTDRPDITESSIVVPKASLQVENGFTWTDNDPGRLISLCQSLLRVGIGNAPELRLAQPAYSLDLFRGNAGSGVSDLSIGLKRQIGPLAGGFAVR
jgi:hypothetical protein